jgi:hypothetical protein
MDKILKQAEKVHPQLATDHAVVMPRSGLLTDTPLPVEKE